MSKKKKYKIKPATASGAEAPQATTAKKTTSKKIFFFREHRLPLLIIFVMAIGLYFQSVNFDYTLDDKMVITGNKFTQRGIDGIGDIFRYESFRGYFGEKKDILEGDRYRPLSIASFAIEKSLGGNKAISHFINVLLYALTGILLYRILLFMFPASGEGKKKWYCTVPFIASLLFIVHPLHVEVTANIKGRDELFALLGEAVTLYCTFKYLSEKRTRWLFFSFLAFLAGLLSKEGVITFLAIVPLTAHFFTTATTGEKIKVTIPVLTGTIIYLLMRVNAIGYLLGDNQVTDLMNNPFYGMNFGEKTATIFYTLLLYLKLHIIPYPLTHDYYPYHIPVMHWSDLRTILSLMIYAGLIVVIIKGWKKRSVWAYAAAFYLITLSIVSNFVVSVGTFMNERFVYHASLGFCIAVAWLLSEVMTKTKLLKTVACIIFVAMVTVFSIRTLERLPDWRNNLSLDRSALRYSPNSARANCFYGIEIWENVYMKLPANADPVRRYAVLDSMKPYFEKSIQILTDYKADQTMRAGLAAEYHKLNYNYDDLIRVFEQINLSGVNEKFVLEYLQYANKIVTNRTDAEKLSAFYTRMINFYSKTPSSAVLNGEYKKLQEGIRSRIATLN